MPLRRFPRGTVYTPVCHSVRGGNSLSTVEDPPRFMSPIWITNISGIPHVTVAVADGSPVPVAAGVTSRASASTATEGAKRPRHLRLVK